MEEALECYDMCIGLLRSQTSEMEKITILLRNLSVDNAISIEEVQYERNQCLKTLSPLLEISLKSHSWRLQVLFRYLVINYWSGNSNMVFPHV